MYSIMDVFKRARELSLMHKHKVRNLEDIIIKLTNYANRDLGDIQGCTEEEILEVEAHFGNLPIVYKNIMMAIGKGIRNVDRSLISRRDDFFLDEVLELSYTMTELDPLEESIEVDVSFPENIFFIYSLHTICVYFVLTNKNDYDAPVFIEDFNKKYSPNEEYILTKAYGSIWDWIDDYLEMKIGSVPDLLVK